MCIFQFKLGSAFSGNPFSGGNGNEAFSPNHSMSFTSPSINTINTISNESRQSRLGTVKLPETVEFRSRSRSGSSKSGSDIPSETTSDDGSSDSDYDEVTRLTLFEPYFYVNKSHII